ncbi:hypothetical protein FVQ98_12700 [Ottowia sp. GY511]|uniref:Uncharacterized protein n=1 Tax=Ottowia flava TaxID=2675430 RepID=A0ABW4KPF8_9BURK|nr:hypothetical protein [Ottowia sp. GY511]TXK26789.1 hypothetical protein FVQ98_12700 [Ottowia sp. GY511]
MKRPALLIAAAFLLAGAAHAAPDAVNDDDVLPNSPWKEHGIPDAGKFNPTWRPFHEGGYVAPAAMTYYPPMVLVEERLPKPYALVAAPTLPCAPGYCPIRAPRPDRN